MGTTRCKGEAEIRLVQRNITRLTDQTRPSFVSSPQTTVLTRSARRVGVIMFSPFSFSIYIRPQGNSTAEKQRGAERTTIEVLLLLCLLACMFSSFICRYYCFGFPTFVSHL
jgi:hypothetical protein